MRWFLSITLAFLGAVSLVFYALGQSPWDVARGLGFEVGTAPSPHAAGLLLVAAAVAFAAALVVRPRSPVRALASWYATWGGVLEVAFAGSVALVALIILLAVILAGGFLPSAASGPETLGTLGMAAAFQAVVGSGIATVLFCIRHSRGKFLATLAVHAVEVGLLGWVFFLGSSA